MSTISKIRWFGSALARKVRSLSRPAPETPQTPAGRFKGQLNAAGINNVSPRLQTLLLAVSTNPLDAANVIIELRRVFSPYENEALTALEAALENGRNPQQFLRLTDLTQHPFVFMTTLPVFYQTGYSDEQIEFLMGIIEIAQKQFALYPALKSHLPNIARLAVQRHESSLNDYLLPLIDNQYAEYAHLAIAALPGILEAAPALSVKQIRQLLAQATFLFSTALAKYAYQGIGGRLREGNNFDQINAWLLSSSEDARVRQLDPAGMAAVALRPHNLFPRFNGR